MERFNKSQGVWALSPECFPAKIKQEILHCACVDRNSRTLNFGMSAWKSKPGGGMGPGPGGDRPTTYDIFVGNLSEEADEVS